MPAANQRVAAGRGLPPAAVETRPGPQGGITTMSQADGLDGLSRNGGARVSSNGRDWWPVCAGCIPDGWPRRGLHRPARVSQGAARGVGPHVPPQIIHFEFSSPVIMIPSRLVLEPPGP